MSSTVPAALAALATRFAAAVPDLQTEVGPNYDPRRSILSVGWAGVDTPAIQAHYKVADARMARDEEDYDVANMISVFHGKFSTVELYPVVYRYFDAVIAALNADPTLGGTVARARLVEHQAIPEQAEGGTLLALRFSINVRAWKV